MNRRSRRPKAFLQYFAVPSVVAALPWAFMLAQGNTASAAVNNTLYVYPGLLNSGLFEYGWHFDETGYANFGAKDYNFAGDDGASALLWAKTGLDPYFPVRFKLEQYGSCGVRATMEYFDGVNVHPIAKTQFHFLHLTNRPASPTYTAWADQPDQWLAADVGQLAACATSVQHLHESAELDNDYPPTAEIDRVGQLDDTCWSNTDTWECPNTNYRVHQTCTSSNGTGGLSGNITQYQCEEWSIEYRDPKSPTFQVVW